MGYGGLPFPLTDEDYEALEPAAEAAEAVADPVTDQPTAEAEPHEETEDGQQESVIYGDHISLPSNEGVMVKAEQVAAE